VPLDGVLPLSSTLDSAGRSRKTVADCALLDQVLAAEANGVPAPAQLHGQRFAVPKTVFQNDLSPAVADACTAALGRLSAAGTYWWHRQWRKDGADKYDPRVIVRICPGETITAASCIELIKLREQFIRTINAAAGYDAMLMPPTPETAPTIAEAGKDDETYTRFNLRMLRNPAIVNLFDGCALSVPCHVLGTAPVGMMIAGNAKHRPQDPGDRSGGGKSRL
jgi:aspartyl-tRNA(Asn)/glutamyl-tRNA(Gln) amidotransferase subunit A